MDGLLYRDSHLGSWLVQEQGGRLNASLVWRKETTGHRLEATELINAQDELVAMPFDLAITPSTIKTMLPQDATRDLKDHAVMCLYLVLLDLHLTGQIERAEMKHTEYGKTLPRPEQMQTALWFNEAEFDLLRGSNLYPAVQERRREWEAEYGAFTPEQLASVGLDRDLFTWPRYLWACTIVSTRAFGSYLLDGDKPNATQVLLPGIDVFNHRRGTAVTWFSNYKERKMQLITDEPIQPGDEVYNNYGAKPNDELLLGYGFVLKDNPEDFVSLKMGTSGDSRPATILSRLGLPLTKAHYVKNGITALPGEILAQLRVLVAEEEELEKLVQQEDEKQEETKKSWEQTLRFLSWPNELEMLEGLGGMLEAKADGMRDALERTRDCTTSRPNKKLKTSDGSNGQQEEPVREHIREMNEIYLKSQVDIFELMLQLHAQLFETSVAKAKSDGFDIDEEEEDSEDDEVDSQDGES